MPMTGSVAVPEKDSPASLSVTRAPDSVKPPIDTLGSPALTL